MKVFGVVWMGLGYLSPLCADVLPLPSPENHVVGEMQIIHAKASDTLLDLARNFDVGYEEIIAANPDVDPWVPKEGAPVKIPSRHILPNAPRKGIVINLAEMRLYYYPRQKLNNKKMVVTHPISVGRKGWTTPLGPTKITAKQTDPPWYPPESIRKEKLADGIKLPSVVPAGPDNPLGRFALRLGHPLYLIHGTNRPYSIGMRVSHGCLRMYPEDIASLYKQVPVGTPVMVVNQPVKIGYQDGMMYAEAHFPLTHEPINSQDMDLTFVVKAVVASTTTRLSDQEWNRLFEIARQHSGTPTAVSKLEKHYQ
ncbi:MAG: L,D-transpeptidase family protein [Gammaproteobacteria bacterium]